MLRRELFPRGYYPSRSFSGFLGGLGGAPMNRDISTLGPIGG